MPVGEIRAWSVKGLLGCGCAVTPFYSLPQLKPWASRGKKFYAVHDGRLWPAVSLQFAGGLSEVFILTVLQDSFETSGFLNDFTYKGEQEWNSLNKWSKQKICCVWVSSLFDIVEILKPFKIFWNERLVCKVAHI